MLYFSKTFQSTQEYAMEALAEMLVMPYIQVKELVYPTLNVSLINRVEPDLLFDLMLCILQSPLLKLLELVFLEVAVF